jgi:hypothetical protein
MTLLLPWQALISQDGDLVMQEAGAEGPTVSEVAERLAGQNLEKESKESVADIIARVQEESEQEQKKVARKFIQKAKLVQAGKLGGGLRRAQKGADEVGNKGRGGAPVEVDPALAVAIIPKPNTGALDEPAAADVEEHVGDAAEKRKRKRGKRKRGKRKRGKGGQGAKDGPDRPQAGHVAVRGPPLGVRGASGKCPIPNPDNRPNLFLPREQRKADVDQRLAALNGPRPTR